MAIGAYAIERDYSHYIAYAAKTIFAVVGTATKGPIGVATVCTSAQDLVNKFGPLKPGYYGLYAGQYYLSQATKLYFVRVASENIAAPTVAIKGTSASADVLEDAITFAFNEKGTYGNGYQIRVSAGTIEDTYKLEVLNPKNAVIETITDIELDTLTAKDAAGNYTYQTSYIKVVDHNTSALILDTTVETAYVLSEGSDGTEGTIDYNAAIAALSAETVDMNLFAVPGVTEKEIISNMVKLAEDRGDCMYLVDPPLGYTKDGIAQWCAGTDDQGNALPSSSYAALYYDWTVIYDSVNKMRVTVPPSVSVAASIAYSDRISEVWYAPAGLTRGVVRGILEPATKLSKSDIDQLYNDCNVNAIYEDPQVGPVIWGQKTLYRGDSALNRINVRRLLNYLKRIVVAATNYLTFEPNDRMTWNSFEMKVAPVLESIKARRGLYEYSIIKGETIVTDEDIDNYRMPCMIMIRPTKAAEEIPIYFTITSTGADFNEVLESNIALEL